MFPYYLLIIFPFYFEVVETILHPNQGCMLVRKRSNKSIILFFAIWFILLSLRHISCGVDLWNYERHFYRTFQLDFFNIFSYYEIEQLYFAFNWIVAQIYPDFRLFLIVTAALCAGITGWFYWKESESALLTILLFVTNACFPMFYSGLRQSLAVLFVIPAYYLTKHKKIIPFIGIVLIAMQFHYSAFIMFLLYPIFHIPLQSKYFVLILLLVAVFFVFKKQFFYIAIPFLGEKHADAIIVETNGYSVWLMFLAFLVYAFVIPDNYRITSEIMGLRNILVLMTLIQGFVPINPLAMRMNYYFILLFPIIIPKVMSVSKDKYVDLVQFSKWVMLIFLTFMFFYNGHTRVSTLQNFPYVAYWE